MSDTIDQFKSAMLAAGLTPPDDIIGEGGIHRFSTNNKGGDTAGWYILGRPLISCLLAALATGARAALKHGAVSSAKHRPRRSKANTPRC